MLFKLKFVKFKLRIQRKPIGSESNILNFKRKILGIQAPTESLEGRSYRMSASLCYVIENIKMH
jgi:hypothetical protein